MSQSLEFEVVVIGAGVAGLAAARKLAEAQKRVALLEARERVGGRIYTIAAQEGSLPIELGAEFIHGLPPELIELVEEAGLTTFELDGDFRCYCCENGTVRPISCDEQRGALEVLEKLGSDPLPETAGDLTFSEYLALRNLPAETARRATNYVEGFNAADANRISIVALAKQQQAEDAISGDRISRITEGYRRVPEYLLDKFREAGGVLFPSTKVESVRWSREAVEVEASGIDPTQRQIFQARKTIVAVPLGVLQARSINFHPPPIHIFRAADRMAMGPVGRVVFEFRDSVWREFSELEGVSFLFAWGAIPPTWWTTSPIKSGLLTGWVGGSKVEKLHLAELPEKGLETLASILAKSKSELKEHLKGSYIHDWQSDPLSLGAYSYVPKGAIRASEEMTQPTENTLFFAGEHTDTTGHWGTVHGAIRSGYRAAGQLLGRGQRSE